MDFPTLYASGRDGYVRNDPNDGNDDVRPLLDAILKRFLRQRGTPTVLQLLVSSIDYNEYVGRLGIGRIERGTVKQGEEIVLMLHDGTQKKARIQRLTVFEGLKKADVESASAGEIVAIAGFADVEIGETFASAKDPERMTRSPSTSDRLDPVLRQRLPFAGLEGKYVTSRNLKDRLEKELRKRRRTPRQRRPARPIASDVAGRGELHLSILAENMRREGFEFALSRRRSSRKKSTVQKAEPYEAW